MEIRRFDLNGRELTKEDLKNVKLPDEFIDVYRRIMRQIAEQKGIQENNQV